MFLGPDFFQNANLPPVVIVGSGPAGMSLGVALAERQISSLILEAGEIDVVPAVQDDYIGQTTGDAYFDLDITRLRMFGGSSNHWGGWCRPLDEWDFNAVPDLGVPGWPIGKTDLDPFAARTRDILEIPERPDQPIDDDLFEAQFVFSPPIRFGEKYEQMIRSSAHLHVALRTAVTAMIAQDGRISRLEIVDANGEARTISPAFVVLACGGIENSRLLMWSNEVSPQPVVADPDTLGRYWMEHPHEDVGTAMVKRNFSLNGSRRAYYLLGMRPERLMEFGALNASVRLLTLRNTSLRQRLNYGMCDVAPELLELGNSLAGMDMNCGQQIKVVWEQAPDSENRIALSDSERDRFGIPRSHLFWRKTAQDYHTAKVAFELVGRYLVRTGNGIVRADRHLIEMGGYPERSEIGGHHHMGGTRMADVPKQGVVNKDLRIHGLSNGYVAGSSVFVRAGHANPTYTIVQLSLRLADHLSAQLA